jgi:hypothetical protein
VSKINTEERRMNLTDIPTKERPRREDAAAPFLTR